MTASRKKLITGTVLLLGIGVLVVTGIIFYPSLVEQYWLRKLESRTEEEQLEATARLVELKSLKAIPLLIEATAVALMRPEFDWAIELPRSSLILWTRTFRMPGGFERPRYPWIFVDAIQKISRDRQGPAEKLLQRSLSDDREFVRALAASVLFEGTDRARQYVSHDRLYDPRSRA